MNQSEVVIEQLNTEELLALRQRVDQRLDVLRTAFIDQAAALGLVVTNGDGKRKRKPRGQREERE